MPGFVSIGLEMDDADIPFLDLTAPDFSTRSDAVREARRRHWCAQTPFGFAVLRHKAAGQILRDRRFRQGSYAWPDTQNLNGSFADFWKRSIISIEGADHKAQRQIALTALSMDFVNGLRPEFTRIAEELITDLENRRDFDFVADFTEPFAGRAITTLLGLPDDQAATIAKDATSLGLAMGVGSKQYEGIFNPACDRLFDVADALLGRAQGGDDTAYVGRMWGAACAIGHTDQQVLRDLIVISIFGGVDTTRAQLGFAVRLFMDHPAQWQALRANPDLTAQAIEEVIRHNPTTTWATREAVEDLVFEGIAIPKGTTVHVLVHATATDPLVDASGGFDISKRRKSHFGFGGGAHHCLGQLVARTDMACALNVMVRHWCSFHWAGEPEWAPDSGNTAPVTMPVSAVWA